MNFDSGGEHDLMGRRQALFIGKRFEEEFCGLSNIRQRLFDGCALRLAPLQLRAPCVAAMLVLFNHHADLAHHPVSLSRWQRCAVCRGSRRFGSSSALDQSPRPRNKAARPASIFESFPAKRAASSPSSLCQAANFEALVPSGARSGSLPRSPVSNWLTNRRMLRTAATRLTKSSKVLAQARNLAEGTPGSLSKTKIRK